MKLVFKIMLGIILAWITILIGGLLIAYFTAKAITGA